MRARVRSSHSIRLSLPIDECFRLFTPAGEELWATGWKPRYVYPSSGQTEAGMVFTTGDGAEATIWTLVDFYPRTHCSRYSRVTPALRAGFVEIRCREVSTGETETSVTYELTALTPQGVVSLAAYSGAAFAQMIDGWKREIDARLSELRRAPLIRG